MMSLSQLSDKYLSDSAHTSLPNEELDLVKRCTNGEERAYLELFELYQEDVPRLIARMLGQNGDISNVTIDVFLQIFRTLSNYRVKWPLTTWIYRVTVNAVLRYRKQHRLYAVAAEDTRRSGLSPSSPTAALERLLDQLSENKRTVFILRELQMLTLADIGRIVGAPIFVIQTRLCGARRELLALIQSDPTLNSLELHDCGPGRAQGPGAP